MNRRELLKALAVTLGASASGTVARAVMAGVSSSDPVDAPTLGASQMTTITRVAELIIPTTDTPGAIAAGVPAFIQVIHSRWYRPDERAQFDVGLTAFETAARASCSLGFEQCSEEQQHSLLVAAETQPTSPAGRFFTAMKELTVFGYYTSEVGSKQELVYNPVPMRYKGDYLFADVGRQWTP